MKTVNKTGTFVAILLIALAWRGWTESQTIVEPKTKTSFPRHQTFNDQPEGMAMTCAGTGLRKKFIFKVYAYCFYVNPEEIRAMYPNGFHGTVEDYKALIHGKYHRGFIMHFVRGVGKGKIVGAYRGDFKKHWKTGVYHEKAETVQAFLKAVNHDIQKHQEIRIWIDDEGTIFVRSGQHPITHVKDNDLAQTVTAIWYDEHPVSKSLKRTSVAGIPAMLKAKPGS